MELFDTATLLRMSNHHVRQIATDVEKSRGAMTACRDNRFVRVQPQRIAWIRRSAGTLLIRTGERLNGTSTSTIALDSPQP